MLIESSWQAVQGLSSKCDVQTDNKLQHNAQNATTSLLVSSGLLNSGMDIHRIILFTLVACQVWQSEVSSNTTRRHVPLARFHYNPPTKPIRYCISFLELENTRRRRE